MQIVHTQKFIRMSPRKLRVVADVVRNLEPNRAVELLPHINKRAASPLRKVIKTAIANAKDQSLKGEMIIKEIQINEGPSLKRGRPVSRGRWHPYKRRMSHVRVVLSTINSEVQSPPKTQSKNPAKPKKSTTKSSTKKKTDTKSGKGEKSQKKSVKD